MDNFVADPATVMKAKEWSTINESIISINEFLEALTLGQYRTIRVATLRKQLEEANLELDGSRKALENRLKVFHRQKVNKGAKD